MPALRRMTGRIRSDCPKRLFIGSVAMQALPLESHKEGKVLSLFSVALVLLTILLTGERFARALPATPVFSVNSTGDAHAGGDLTNGICQTDATNNVCTLRAAIEKANQWPGGGVTINFNGVTPPATYLLQYGELAISNTLTMLGAGATS